MGFEARGKKKYYYSKKWEKGRCISKYIGPPDTAEIIAECERGRQIEKQQIEARRQAQKAIDDEIDKVTEINKSLVDALFLINGYRQHKRQWRKKR